MLLRLDGSEFSYWLDDDTARWFRLAGPEVFETGLPAPAFGG